MQETNNGSEALISGIEKDAKQEAERIVKDAEKAAAELGMYTTKQVDGIIKEASEKARMQSEAIKKKVLSGVDIEVNRKSLYMKDKIVNDVLGRVREEFRKLIKEPGYREILLSWIVEAAVGLGVPQAKVSVSKDEKGLVDAKLLKEAEKRAKKLSGKDIKLMISEDLAQAGQSIVLTASDGRTAFNNQVSTRLLRKQREIRNLIYKELFDE
jgi:vacuolar-type H+-ATPase subunit E/Vma4